MLLDPYFSASKIAWILDSVPNAMAQEGIKLQKLRIDGGMVSNNWLCQFLSDVLNLTVERAQIMETTALGAAYLAGLQAGIYQSCEDLISLNQVNQRFYPHMDKTQRARLLSGWHSAVNSTIGFQA